MDKPGKSPEDLILYKSTFLSYAADLLSDGRESGEIKERKYISDHYHLGLWLQCLFLLNYWIKDTSLGAENTDAAVEKSINVGFDMLSEGSFENLFDLGKFLFQTWK